MSVKIPPLREYWYFVIVDGTPLVEPVNATLNAFSEPSIAVANRDDGAEPTRFVVAVPELSDRDDSHEPFEIALRRIEY